METIHFLTTVSDDLFFTKKFGLNSDGIIEKYSYGHAKTFTIDTTSISGIWDLHKHLTTRESFSRTALIRGGLKQGVPKLPGDRVQKLLRDKKNYNTGKKELAHWVDVPRQWGLLDIENLIPPSELDVSKDPEEAVDWVVGLLPPDFQAASCHWQFSSSQGIPVGGKPGDPAPRDIRIHLWYWLDRKVLNTEWKAFIKQIQPDFVGADGTQGSIDASVFSAVQPHYIANPIINGFVDPLPRRSGFRNSVVAEVNFPQIDIKQDYQKTHTETGEGGHHAKGFENILRLMGDGTNLGGFNDPILRSIASYVSQHGADGTDREWLKDRIREAIEDAPTADSRSYSDLERYASDTYLDECIEGAIQKFGDGNKRGKLIHGVEPYWPGGIELPADQARERLGDVVRESLQEAKKWHQVLADKAKRLEGAFTLWKKENPSELLVGAVKAKIKRKVNKGVMREFGFDDLIHAPRTQIKATAAIGKTRAMVDILGDWKEGVVYYLVPDLNLADELVNRLEAAGLSVALIEGRKKPLCCKPEACRQAAVLGIPIFESMCHQTYFDTSGVYQVVSCKEYNGCAYLNQFKTKVDVYVMAHEYLSLPINSNLPKPSLVVVDESVAQKMVSETSFCVDRLNGPVAGIVRSCLENETDLRKCLQEAGYTKEKALQDEKRYEVEFPHRLSPLVNEKRALRLLSNLYSSDDLKLKRFWSQVADEWDLNRSFNGINPVQNYKVQVNDKVELQDRIFVNRRRDIKIPESVPIILLDASAYLGQNQKIFGKRLNEIEIRAEQNIDFIQIYSATMAKGRLCGIEDEPQMTDDLQKICDTVIDFETKQGQTLVVCNKPVRMIITGEKPGEKLQPSSTAIGADIAHYGTIRGIDQWRDHETIITLGREEPTHEAVERIAGGFYWDDSELLVRGPYIEESRGYRMKDGSLVGVMVRVLPDPRSQSMLEQSREREVEQAIARCRPVGASKRKRAVILSNIPLDITVDWLVSWPEMQTIYKAERIVEQLDGVIPLSPTFLHNRLPGDFETLESARNFCRQEIFKRCTCSEIPNSNIYYKYHHMCTFIFSPGISSFTEPIQVISRLPEAESRHQLELWFGPAKPFQAALLLQHEGAIVLSPDWLQKNCQEIFPSKDTAKRAIKKYQPETTGTFKRIGQRRPSNFMGDPLGLINLVTDLQVIFVPSKQKKSDEKKLCPSHAQVGFKKYFPRPSRKPYVYFFSQARIDKIVNLAIDSGRIKCSCQLI